MRAPRKPSPKSHMTPEAAARYPFEVSTQPATRSGVAANQALSALTRQASACCALSASSR